MSTMKVLSEILIMLLFVFALTITKCVNPPKADEPTPPSNLVQFTVHNEEVSDTPIKTQVSLDILLTMKENEEITEQKIRDLLNYLYEKTINRTGFEYNKHPTNVFIYIYTTEERAEAGMGQWIGMVSKTYGDDTLDILVNEKEIQVLSAGEQNIHVEKWGLTTEERKEVWRNLIFLQDKAQKEAEAKYPLDDPNVTIDEIGKYNQYYSDLNKKYKIELANQFGITVSIVDSIVKEGFKQDWTIPAR